MGNLLSNGYSQTTRIAFSSSRNKKNDTEVIDLDDHESDDSSVEEVILIRDERGGRPLVTTGVQELGGKKLEGKLQSSSSALLGRRLDSLSLDLLQSPEKRNSKLKELGFGTLCRKKRREWMHWLRGRSHKPEDRWLHKHEGKVTQELLTPLTKEEIAEVQLAFSPNNRRKVLVTHRNSNISLTGQLMHCLSPRGWLNDEVINLYFELLKERETREPQKFLKCHFFNTFFYRKLVAGGSGYSYNAVRRWTSEKKLGYHLFECDKIFVPIHNEVHWCLAVINKKDRKFQYLDSLKGMDERVLRTVLWSTMAKYFVEEVREKSGINLDVNSWDQEIIEDLPEQQNGFDCGVFMLKYVDCYSRGLGLCFGQQHMPYFRLRTAKEILKLRAN